MPSLSSLKQNPINLSPQLIHTRTFLIQRKKSYELRTRQMPIGVSLKNSSFLILLPSRNFLKGVKLNTLCSTKRRQRIIKKYPCLQYISFKKFIQVFNCIDSFTLPLELRQVRQDITQESNKNQICVIFDYSIHHAGFSLLEPSKIYLKIKV